MDVLKIYNNLKLPSTTIAKHNSIYVSGAVLFFYGIFVGLFVCLWVFCAVVNFCFVCLFVFLLLCLFLLLLFFICFLF